MDRDIKCFHFEEATPLNIIGLPTGGNNLLEIPLIKTDKTPKLNYTSIYLRTSLIWLVTLESLSTKEPTEERYAEFELENSHLVLENTTSFVKGSSADNVYKEFLSREDESEKVINFVFESTNYRWSIGEISDYDMQNLYQDLEFIILNSYTLSSFKQSNSPNFKSFECSLASANFLNSVETIKLALYMYQNPIEFKDNYLKVNTNYLYNNFVYSLNVEGITVYFNIYLSVDEVTCVSEIYWLRTQYINTGLDNLKPFDRIHLERHVNLTLFSSIEITWGWELEELMIQDQYYTSSDWPMAFKYYSDGSYEGIKSECEVSSKYIRRYLDILMSNKLYYMSPNSLDTINCKFWDSYTHKPII